MYAQLVERSQGVKALVPDWYWEPAGGWKHPGKMQNQTSTLCRCHLLKTRAWNSKSVLSDQVRLGWHLLTSVQWKAGRRYETGDSTLPQECGHAQLMCFLFLFCSVIKPGGRTPFHYQSHPDSRQQGITCCTRDCLVWCWLYRGGKGWTDKPDPRATPPCLFP